MPNGIDVYTKYQNVTDWFLVRGAGYEFCYVKVTDGLTTRADNGYGPKGRAGGVAMGAYHYAQFGDPVRQANLFIDRVLATGLTDLAPALDLEDPFTPNQTAIDFAIAFLKQVKARGFRPALYANNSMLSTTLGQVRAAVPDVIVWVARYSVSAPTVGYDVWQWTDKGHVPGISAGSVDLNRGRIPYNLAPSQPVRPAATPTLRNDEDEDVMPLFAAGDNVTDVIPCAGRPQFWYLYNIYGNEILVHQVDYVMDTGSRERFVPGAGFNDGSIGPDGKFARRTPYTWEFAENKPGWVNIPKTVDGRSPVGVVIRYSAKRPFRAYCG